jgi:hydrogenase-4 component B
MTKVGIYGLLRVFCWMLPPSGYSETWGMVIALLGAGSVFVGTLSTLPEHVAHDDTKRFLSFHVIGQIGYMLLGLGIGIYFLNINPLVATLALMATVFHLVNNVCYKSLLYLNAGSILYRTNTRDLNQVSGLGAIMPLTALTAAVGALAIAGMPPLNGFASKWMLYSVSILSPQPMFPVFVILGVMAMFISLVTLASFLKFIGAAFLGTFAAPKNNTLDRGDVPLTMQIPQVVLAGLCVLFGLVPALPLFGVHKAISAALPANMQHNLADLIGNAPGGVSLMLTGNQPTGIWLPLIVFAALLICIGLSKWIYGLGGAARRTVSGWNCGVDIPSELVRYQARSFYGPFKKAFSRLYPMVGVPKMGYPNGLARLFDIDSWLYGPLVRFGRGISERLSHTHVGIPQMYLIWQVAGAALVLTALFLMLK